MLEIGRQGRGAPRGAPLSPSCILDRCPRPRPPPHCEPTPLPARAISRLACPSVWRAHARASWSSTFSPGAVRRAQR
jgi:hypothetical protein